MCFDEAKYQFAYFKQFLANPDFAFAFRKKFYAYLCRWLWSLYGFCVGFAKGLCGFCVSSVWVLSGVCVGFVKGLCGFCPESV